MNYPGLIIESYGLIKNFKKSREEILKIRETKYRNILRHAYNHSIFYREYYSGYGIHKKDLEDIPITSIPAIDKKIFIENFDKITTKQALNKKGITDFVSKEHDINKLYMGEYIILHSSGSTGQPTYFVYDRKAWQTILAAALRACIGDMSISEVVFKGLKEHMNAIYIAATDGRFGGVVAASSGLQGFGFTPLMLNINTPIEQWINAILSFKPNIIIGYPSAIKILCDIICKKKIHLNVIKLLTVGEPLTKQFREYFQATLNIEVINVYGASESLTLGLERDHYKGYYIFDDINYLEVEKEGTYLTPLYNFSQPLIRYKLSDKLESMEREPKEVLPFTKIEKIMGRNEEIMWFINEEGEEDFLHPLIIDDIEVEGIINFQFVQCSNMEVEIRVVVKEDIDFEEIRNNFSHQLNIILEEKKLSNIKYWVTKVQKIEINPDTGKKPMVIKKVS